MTYNIHKLNIFSHENTAQYLAHFLELVCKRILNCTFFKHQLQYTSLKYKEKFCLNRFTYQAFQFKFQMF